MSETATTAAIKVYGTRWCPDCHRAKRVLAERHVDFEWIDIDQDDAAWHFVEDREDGGRTIPLILFPDGTQLVEPSDDALARRLDIARS